MTLVRYNLDSPKSFSNLVDKLFSEAIADNRIYRFLPDVDFAETETSYELHIAAPGLNKEDFNIEVANGNLVVSGERKFVNEEKNKKFHSVETKYGSFSRSFHIPENSDITKIEAEYVNGILKINIPKDTNKLLKTKVAIK